MHAPRTEVASRHECLSAKLMLKIKGPTLHIGSLKIRINAGDILNRKADDWISGKRIVECSGINDCSRLKRRIGTDQPRLLETERQLIKVDAVSSPDRSRSFLKWVPSNSYPRCEVIAGRRDRLAKR